MPYYRSLIALLFAVFASARDIQFENCGRCVTLKTLNHWIYVNGGDVNAVQVEPCAEEPCSIPRGHAAIITVHCLPSVDAEELKLHVTAEVAGIEVPYPGMKRNACQGKNITCPISANQSFYYVQKFEVKPFFPKIKTVAKFELITNDDKHVTICCFKTPVHVV